MAVVVSSPHRAEAFEAARFCIDTLKETVPIWKREHWEGGSDWGTGAQSVLLRSAEELPLSRDLAIDLGTANTLVYARGQGIILNEPTVIAHEHAHPRGARARARRVADDRPHARLHRRRPPLRGGAITDFEITQRLIRHALPARRHLRGCSGPGC